MASITLKPALIIAGIFFLVVDAILIAAFCIYWRRKKKREREEADEREVLIIRGEPLKQVPVRPVKAQAEIFQPSQWDVFAIPLNKIEKDGEKRKLKQTTLGRQASMRQKSVELGTDKLDIASYAPTSFKRNLASIPRLGFTFFYDFRTTQLKITLRAAKHLPKYFNEKVIVSILMSHCPIVYHSSKVDAPDALFNEEYPFPLESMEISADPPVTVKFNVWYIDKNSRKNPYGYVQVNIEDILSQTGITADGGSTGKVEWRNIMQSDQLTDEGLKGEVLVTLSYLSAAQRIGITIVKAKDLILTANDRDIFAKITVLCRDEEQQSVVTNFTSLKQNPEFNEEFIFRFADLRNASIEGVALRIDIIARQVGLLEKPRVLGQCYLGNTSNVDRRGKEHWVTTLTSPKTVTNWHMLKDTFSDDHY